MAAPNLRAAAKAMRSLPERYVRDSVSKVAKVGNAALGGDTGGDRRLSGARGGGQLKVSTKVQGSGSVVTGEAKAGPPRMRAQWFWIEEGARRRIIGRTRAKHTWSRAVEPLVPELRTDAASKLSAAVRGSER